MGTLAFSKYHGCHNSFVLFSRADIAVDVDLVALARRVCDPGSGIGSDGMFVVGEFGAPITVAMFNPDGSSMGMCGNGIRCVYRYVVEHLCQEGRPPRELTFSVEGREIICSSDDAGQTVRVDMGEPATTPPSIPFLYETEDVPTYDLTVATAVGDEQLTVSVVSMGNPHCVLVGDENLRSRVAELGPLIEHHPRFSERTNVEFVSVESRHRLHVAVWERGAGVTQACGTGACAVAVALSRRDLCDRSVAVVLPGGTVQVLWDASSNHVFLTGPADYIAQGVLSL